MSSPVANPTSKRYVITAPPDDFPLVSSDLVFCLMQFDYCTGMCVILSDQSDELSFTKATIAKTKLIQNLYSINKLFTLINI